MTEILRLAQSFSTTFPSEKKPLTEDLHEHPVISEELDPADGSSSHSQPSGAFYLAVCHAVRRGRPQSLPSPSTVTRHSSSLRRPNGNSPISATGLRGRGCPAVILMEYWINGGQRSCLHSKPSISFMSCQTGDIWQPGKEKRETWRITSTFTLFWLLSVSRSLSVCISLTFPIHVEVEPVLWHCHSLTARIIPRTPKLTLILAFKLSNHWRGCGEITIFLCKHFFTLSSLDYERSIITGSVFPLIW